MTTNLCQYIHPGYEENGNAVPEKQCKEQGDLMLGGFHLCFLHHRMLEEHPLSYLKQAQRMMKMKKENNNVK